MTVESMRVVSHFANFFHCPFHLQEDKHGTTKQRSKKQAQLAWSSSRSFRTWATFHKFSAQSKQRTRFVQPVQGKCWCQNSTQRKEDEPVATHEACEHHHGHQKLEFQQTKHVAACKAEKDLRTWTEIHWIEVSSGMDQKNTVLMDANGTQLCDFHPCWYQFEFGPKKTAIRRLPSRDSVRDGHNCEVCPVTCCLATRSSRQSEVCLLCVHLERRWRTQRAGTCRHVNGSHPGTSGGQLLVKGKASIHHFLKQKPAKKRA